MANYSAFLNVAHRTVSNADETIKVLDQHIAAHEGSDWCVPGTVKVHKVCRDVIEAQTQMIRKLTESLLELDDMHETIQAQLKEM